jgi:hypothetical protein
MATRRPTASPPACCCAFFNRGQKRNWLLPATSETGIADVVRLDNRANDVLLRLFIPHQILSQFGLRVRVGY